MIEDIEFLVLDFQPLSSKHLMLCASDALTQRDAEAPHIACEAICGGQSCLDFRSQVMRAWIYLTHVPMAQYLLFQCSEIAQADLVEMELTLVAIRTAVVLVSHSEHDIARLQV